jgi:hypothetical protein
LAAQVLDAEGYTSIDPAHPLGGPDGGKDARIKKDDELWIMAAYFPLGQQSFNDTKAKFVSDHAGVAGNDAKGMAFVTNQALSLGERNKLEEAVGTPVDIFHLERVTHILDRRDMAGVRLQFLGIPRAPTEAPVSEPLTFSEIREATASPPGAPEHPSPPVYEGMLRLQVRVVPVPAGVRDTDASRPLPALEAAAEAAREVTTDWPEKVSLLTERLAEGWTSQAAHCWGAGRTTGDAESLTRSPTAAACYITKGCALRVDRTWVTRIDDDGGQLAYFAAREPEVVAELLVALRLGGALLERLPDVNAADLSVQIAAAPSGKTLVSSEAAVSGGRFGDPAGYLPKPVTTEVETHYLDNARVTLDELRDPYLAADTLIGPWLSTFRSDDLLGRLRSG